MLDGPGVVLGVASLVLGEGMEQRHAELVVRAGVDAGAAALDTARAYASVEDDAVGERLAVIAEERRPGIPVITKAGHYRLGTASWDADGSAARLRRDAERSVEVLGGPPALLLLHRAQRRVRVPACACCLAASASLRRGQRRLVAHQYQRKTLPSWRRGRRQGRLRRRRRAHQQAGA